MSQHLFVLDLDGTTLDNQKKLPRPIADKIKEMQKKQHIIAFASGRPYPEIQSFAEKYELNLPCIYSNGAGVRLPGEKENLQTHPLPLEFVSALLNLFQSYQLRCHLCTADGTWYVNRRADQYIQAEIDYLREQRTYEQQKEKFTRNKNFIIERIKTNHIIKNIDLANLDYPIVKLVVYSSEKEKKAALHEELKNNYSSLYLTSSYPNDIEITDQHATKGEGLKALSKYFNIPLSRTIAVGNDYNDLSMLKIAGRAFAVSNANPEMVSQLLLFRLPLSNEEMAVLYVLESFLNYPIQDPSFERPSPILSSNRQQSLGR
jgi:Cof subfamily protein (haloacid dehalogenase superfamily)